MADFPGLVDEELARARRAFAALHSFHEGFGVIAEEVAEFFDEVRKKGDGQSPDRLLKELVQIAAMAQRTAEDLKLV